MMAAKLPTSQDRSTPTTASVYTLPLSCQICLGKVRQPVLCSNFHVFCRTCIDTWLERSHRCPSCRVLIDHTNPVRHIRGGLNQAEDEEREKSTPELRKLRYDLLYKDYEDTIEQLEHEVRLLRCENARLKSQFSIDQGAGSSSSSNAGDKRQGISSSSGEQQLQLLTAKLQDAQKLYDRVKQDMSRLKTQNHSLKESNADLNRENAKLREEISNRSPHKFGRLTVATLEAQLESQRKEVQRLTRALERSDQYIESLQLQTDKGETSVVPEETGSRLADGSTKMYPLHKQSSGSARDSCSLADPSMSVKRQLFSSQSLKETDFSSADSVGKWRSDDDKNKLTDGSDKMVYSKSDDMLESIMRKSQPSSKTDASMKEKAPGRKVHFSVTEKKGNDSSSFNLEVPSPIVPSTYSDTILSPDKQPARLQDSELPSKPSHRSSYPAVVSNVKASSSDWDFQMDLQTKNDLSSRRVSSCTSTRKQESSSKALIQKSAEHVGRKEPSVDTNSSSNLSEPDFLTPPSLREFDSKKSHLSGKAVAFSNEATGKKDGRIGHHHTNVSFDLEGPNLDDTQTIQTELKDLDISMTPELSDCLKLLNRAERKVSHADLPGLTVHPGTVTTGNPVRVTTASTGGQHGSLGNLHGMSVGYRSQSQSAWLDGMNVGKGGVHVHSEGKGCPNSSGFTGSSGFPGTYVPGTTGIMSSWEHGFFSSLRVNPYRHVAPHMHRASAGHQQDFIFGVVSQSGTSDHTTSAIQSLSTGGSDKMIWASDEGVKQPLSGQSTRSDELPRSASMTVCSRAAALTEAERPGFSLTSTVPSSSKSSSSSAYSGYSKLVSSELPSVLPSSAVTSSTALGFVGSQSSSSSSVPLSSASSLSAGLLSTGYVSNLTSSGYPANIASSSGFSRQESLSCDSHQYNIPPPPPSEHQNGALPTSRVADAGHLPSMEKRSSNNYSYVSTASSQGGDNTDSQHLDSFLPEPKKRLFDFDSEEESDFGTPSKTTKIV